MRIEHFDWLPTGGVGAIVNNVRWSTYALALLKQQYFFVFRADLLRVNFKHNFLFERKT